MRRTFIKLVGVASGMTLVLASSPALAQLDPLLFLKIQAPNVILVVDTNDRMQRDADSTFYDPGDYNMGGSSFIQTLGVQSNEAKNSYRRKYYDLGFLNPSENGGLKFQATRIDGVGDLEPGYATFYERTRLAIARRGLIQAINENSSSARFGLIKTRQSDPWFPNNTGNEGPVTVSDPAQQTPTDSTIGKWKITRTTVSQSNSKAGFQNPLVKSDATGANAAVLSTLGKDLGVQGALIPASADAKDVLDAPVGLMLDDARTEAARLIAADTTGCRNTVVVLVVGGGEGNIDPQDLAAKASTFLNVSGRRVPIYVIAIAPAAADVTSLRAVATNSGGQYFEITKAMIEATTAGQTVPEVVRGVNRAVQHAFASFTDLNTAPTPLLPSGPQTEFQVTSPIVGSVNLKGAQYYRLDTGTLDTLPDSETLIYHASTGTEIPQRSNVMVTSGFAMPGFEGRLRALRVYKPVPDSTKPSGYKFTQDGSRLWVASAPAAETRNIYTVLPGSSTLVKFDSANATALSTYLRVPDAATLIDWIRNRPLGAVIGSTPAFLDAPSLDPPPDADYPAFRDGNQTRRTLVFVGANDGMLHALDARSGVEVWAFIPFNLLPKLRALRSGQSLDAFKYFVDSSPKISDVKVSDAWRTYLFFGQGPGGTFYNALDVTLEDIDDSVSETSTNTTALLDYFSSPGRILWKWSFPRLTSFDHTLGAYGDVAVTASDTEKSVGETWSDPAIGQVKTESGPYVMLVGSGFMKRSVELQSNRGGARAGRSFYVLSVATGLVLATRDVGADSSGESDDNCRDANNCSRVKNALQMDPVATGTSDSRFISSAYIGDLDGKVWRFDLGLSGTTVSLSPPVQLYNAGASQPIFSSMATVNVGGSKQYLFVGTGSDLLPSNGVNESYRLLVLLDNGSSATLTAEILLEKTDGSAGDEKVTAFPAVAGDIVFFTTTTTLPAQVCSPFWANLYGFTFIGGPAYDTNGDGRLTAEPTVGNSKNSRSAGKRGGGNNNTSYDDELLFSVAGARATAPFIVDQHLVFSAGGDLQLFGDPNDFNNGVGQAGVKILSWRVVK